jgi:hypothetical protein
VGLGVEEHDLGAEGVTDQDVGGLVDRGEEGVQVADDLADRTGPAGGAAGALAGTVVGADLGAL